MSSYKKPDKRSFAHDMCDRVVHFLTTSLYADSANFVPISIRSQHSRGPRSSMTSKSVSFADLAKTLKNLRVDFRSAKSRISSFLGKNPTLFYSNRLRGVSLTSLAGALK